MCINVGFQYLGLDGVREVNKIVTIWMLGSLTQYSYYISLESYTGFLWRIQNVFRPDLDGNQGGFIIDGNKNLKTIVTLEWKVTTSPGIFGLNEIYFRRQKCTSCLNKNMFFFNVTSTTELWNMFHIFVMNMNLLLKKCRWQIARPRRRLILQRDIVKKNSKGREMYSDLRYLSLLDRVQSRKDHFSWIVRFSVANFLFFNHSVWKLAISLYIDLSVL